MKNVSSLYERYNDLRLHYNRVISLTILSLETFISFNDLERIFPE